MISTGSESMNVRLPALGACDSYAILGVNSVDSVVYVLESESTGSAQAMPFHCLFIFSMRLLYTIFYSNIFSTLRVCYPIVFITQTV